MKTKRTNPIKREKMVEPVIVEGQRVFVLDQRFLPGSKKYIEIKCADDGFQAIKDMVVRGAPLIGVVAFYSLAVESINNPDVPSLLKMADKIGKARPTAVNLKFACKEFKKALQKADKNLSLSEMVFEKAKEFHKKEVVATQKMAENGLKLFTKKSRVLTYCNAGGLATTGLGTALGIVRYGYEKGMVKEVYACETRPYLQGLRLTAFELYTDGIPFKVICDNTAGFLMKQKKIDAVIVGADRIASNGDTANKIGTYTLAVLSKENKIPFYVAAPLSTVDFSIKDGSKIKIEERSGDEFFFFLDKKIFDTSYETIYFAFDVTPANLISAIVTEYGIVKPPFFRNLKKLLRDIK